MEWEEGELLVEMLEEVFSKDEAARDVGDQPQLMRVGTIKVKRGTRVAVVPSNTEELRRRLRILGSLFSMMKVKRPDQVWFRDLNIETCNLHADYVMGSRVLLSAAKDENGREMKKPSWPLVLSYAYRIRKKAVELTDDGRSLALARKLARKDLDLKQEHFSTPMAIAPLGTGSGSSGFAHQGGDDRGNKKENYEDWMDDMSMREDDRRKDKPAKRPRLPSGMLWKSTTSDVREWCYGFNDPQKKWKGLCGKVHACQGCLYTKHPFCSCLQSHEEKKGKEIEKPA
jgi:hypothetical protein